MGDPVTTTIAAVSTVGSIGLGVEQRNEQKKARQAQRNIQERQLQRQRMQQFREKQQAQAQLTAQAAQGGTLESTGFRGASSSIQSTFAGNMQFSNQIQSIQQDIANRMERASSLGMYRQIGSQIASTASMFAGPSAGSGATPANEAVAAGNTTSSLNSGYLAGGGGLA